MMIPGKREKGNHNLDEKGRNFENISVNGNKSACAGEEISHTADVKIGYLQKRQLTF